MAQDVVYSNKSIIDIGSDIYTVDKGTVSRSDGVLVLGAESRCTFNKSFGDKGIEASKLKVQCSIDKTGVVSRYNDNIAVKLRIQYYEREYKNNDYVYKDSKWQTIELIPYDTNEAKGNYKEDIIDTEEKYIKQMKIIVRNNGTSDGVKLTKLNIFNTVTIDKDAIKTDPDIRDIIDDIISDYISTSDLVIPLINDISEMNSKPDGAIARCSWIEGVGV